MLSIVAPVFNERESLARLVAELGALAREQNLTLDVVLVDDGSSDGSWDEIARLAVEHSWVRGVRFRRNFGKAAALSAGFTHARGEWVMTMDADLQDDPREIPRFLATATEQKLDVVSGWKKLRRDPWHKVLPSRVFNWMVSRLTGVVLHDHNCGVKLYRREIFREVRLYGELHRFVPVLAAARGWRVGEMAVNHRPREYGRSKYGLGRMVKGFLDLLTVKFLTGFGQRPQHVMGVLGLGLFGLGGLGMLWLAIEWVVSRLGGGAPLHIHESALVLYSLGSMLLGAQLLSMGILAELIVAHYGRHGDNYSIAEHTPPAAGETTGPSTVSGARAVQPS